MTVVTTSRPSTCWTARPRCSRRATRLSGRLYTGLGAALTEAGELEKAKTTLDDAQRIAAPNGDERQHAHARVQALLLGLKLDPDDAVIEIIRALPALRREFDQSHDELGICRTLQLEAALLLEPRADPPPPRTPGNAPPSMPASANDRRELAEILSWLASAALWGPTPAPEGIQAL